MNRSFRKTAAVLLAALTAFCLTACGGGTVTTTAAPETAAPTQAVIDITTAAETTEAPTTAPETTAPETTPAPTETDAPTEAPTEADTTEAEQDPFGEEDLVLTVDGVELSLRMDFVPVKDQIFGGNYDEQVGQACVGGGNDRDYYYDGNALEVHTVGGAGGEQTVYDIYIDGVQGFSTAKGAVIGETSRDDVIAVYGEPSFSSLAADRYSIDDFDLIFAFDDNDILSAVGLHDNNVQ